MCLLIHQPQGVVLPSDALADFYSKNEDGFGAVINDGGKVEVIKMVGSLSQTIEMYEKMVAGKESIIHFRMRTHGDIDLANCHPYTVIEKRLWLAHNGILSCSNPVDSKMSDTWHIIKYLIKPVAESNFDMIFDPDWAKVVGNQIGANKFALMDDRGRVAIVNRNAGVEHFDCWLSNTYAWSPQKFGYRTAYSYPTTTYTNPQSKYYSKDLWSNEGGWTWDKSTVNTVPGYSTTTKAKKTAAKSKKSKASQEEATEQLSLADQRVVTALKNCLADPDKMTEWVWKNKHTSDQWLRDHDPDLPPNIVDTNPELIAQLMEDWVFTIAK